MFAVDLFATLVVGIAKMGDIRMVGRIGTKTLGWFLFASLVSLALGLVLVELRTSDGIVGYGEALSRKNPR